ncbi:hypothetical protein SEA_TIERRA_37 [Mycobacterium phage Tierra]|uniref:Uncharacterized protein n=1 Tax=Mycobacterium phage Bryler TaxID=2653755 RepID=A0A5Q2WRI2_9CAUD|nr:hypothetical protein I5G79_gp60 [Mycobacterium phage Bryler]ASR85336.1 hypothetical protein SEA_PHRANK_37 [Mycobacterium phage Phrank]ASR85437.1 hypothetical protein SEA_CAIN_37 [Mycobacterium phage Cain]QGH80413.1 hypothetical protein SEA_BRYLER_37 [Mycobacterium phage Bryler]WNM68326.1 hypothetical protein SEA_TIERRA_37 [Mycobacterium phage Tierra]
MATIIKAVLGKLVGAIVGKLLDKLGKSR